MCVECGPATFQSGWVPRGVTCTPCANFGDSGSGASTCHCKAGFAGPYPNCTSCVPGKYKPAMGSNSCKECAAGTYSSVVSATSQRNCSLCPRGKYSMFPSAYSEVLCLDCAAGKFGPEAGRSEDCETCPQNSGSLQGSTRCKCNANFFGKEACERCPAHSSSPVGSISSDGCQCVPGYTGSPLSSCAGCPEGKFKEGKGSAPCTACPKDHYSPPNATKVSKCYPAPTVVFVLSMDGDISVSQITDDVEDDMLRSIAQALRVHPDTVKIASIIDARRRMLAVKVNVEVLAASQESAQAIADRTAVVAAAAEAAANQNDLNTRISATVSVRAAPLPSPTSVVQTSIALVPSSTPVFVNTLPTEKQTSIFQGPALAGAVAGALTSLVIIVAVSIYWRRSRRQRLTDKNDEAWTSVDIVFASGVADEDETTPQPHATAVQEYHDTLQFDDLSPPEAIDHRATAELSQIEDNFEISGAVKEDAERLVQSSSTTPEREELERKTDQAASPLPETANTGQEDTESSKPPFEVWASDYSAPPEITGYDAAGAEERFSSGGSDK